MGETSKESYDQTIAVIREAEAYIKSRSEDHQPFGGQMVEPLAPEERKRILADILPVIRGAVSGEKRMLVTWCDADDVLEFANSRRAPSLSQVGAACPDHLVHTKRVPAYIPWNPAEQDTEALVDRIKTEIAGFKESYAAYFQRNRHEGDEMFEPAPRVMLIPGIGMVTAGKSLAMAKVSRDLYRRAIAVMKGTEVLGNFVSLNEEESYNVEYWPLELYKLTLAPPEAEFSRKIAFVTGERAESAARPAAALL